MSLYFKRQNTNYSIQRAGVLPMNERKIRSDRVLEHGVFWLTRNKRGSQRSYVYSDPIASPQIQMNRAYPILSSVSRAP